MLILVLALISLAFTLLRPDDAEAASWMPLGAKANVGATSVSDLAIDGATPIAAYRRSSPDRVQVNRWTGSTWVPQGAPFGGGQLAGVEIDSSAIGTFVLDGLQLHEWDGANWIARGGSAQMPDQPSMVFGWLNGQWGGRADTQLALGASTYVAFMQTWKDATSGAAVDSGIYVRRWDGTQWVTLAGPDLLGAIHSANQANPVGLLDLEVIGGQPWACYYTSSGSLKGVHVVRWNGSSWLDVGGSPLPGVDWLADCSITEVAGVPYLTSADTNDVFSTWSWTGAAWQPVGSVLPTDFGACLYSCVYDISLGAVGSTLVASWTEDRSSTSSTASSPFS